MSESIDRSLRLVAVAQLSYRHEAEFAAGFLADAGIPYRLQSDDSGGMEVGITIGRPAVLWVREADVRKVRELLAEDEPPDGLLGEDDDEAWRGGVDMADASPDRRRSPAARRQTPLSGAQRVLAGALAAAAGAATAAVPSGSLWIVVLVAAAVLLAGVAIVGRGPGAVEELLRAVSGEAP